MSDYFDSSQNRITAGSLAKSSEVNAIRDEVGTGFDKLPDAVNLQLNKSTFCTDTGSANSYAVTMPTTQSSYTTGMEVVFTPTHNNTAASTLNVDNIGAKAIKRPDGSDVISGDIKTDQPLTLRYNGTSFVYTGGPVSFYTEATTAASNASTSASAASTSASNASTSEDNAASSASSASTYATNSSNSATASSNSASSASTSASNAATSETNAGNSATAAASSASSIDAADLIHTQGSGLDNELLTYLKTIDGTGSGLDADLLDGQEGSYYRSATNLNAGTLSDARLPASITSSITGNAATATKLATARTIDIDGDVTGSAVSFDGSANVTFHATVGNASHTHTVANLSDTTVTAAELNALSGINTGDEPDASSTVKGIVELADATEATSGTDTTKAMTSAGAKALILNGLMDGTQSANGYVKLPDGTIIQYGTYSSTTDSEETFNYPTTFPTACQAVASQKNYSSDYSLNAIKDTTSQFKVTRHPDESGTVEFNVIAIGY